MKALTSIVRRNPGPTIYLVLTTVVFAYVGIARSQTFVWVYLPALAASVALAVAIDHFKGPIPNWLLWLLVIWASIHLAGGLAPDPSGQRSILYEWWLIDGVLRYDQVVHGYGIGAATATFAYAARSTARPLMWGFFWAQLLGIVNETVENVFAYFVEESNVGDWVNTAWDLGWHLIGSLVALIVMSRRGLPGMRATRARVEAS
jgi:hypothetical protein